MDTEMTQAPKKCPITTKTIVNPCKNTTCDHVYERDAILEYIKGKRQVKCPFAGCTQYLVIR
jgi:SUMO ligase MMS21 Smc5/6 complex component